MNKTAAHTHVATGSRNRRQRLGPPDYITPRLGANERGLMDGGGEVFDPLGGTALGMPRPKP